MTDTEPPSPSLVSQLPAHEIPMARLRGLLDLDGTSWWGHAPITRPCVVERWREGYLEPHPYPGVKDKWPRTRHLDRIGFFCAYGWRDPVVLSLHHEQVRVVDGLHRILAAWVLGHRVITAKVIGGDETKRRVLGVRSRRHNLFYPSPTSFGHARPATLSGQARLNGLNGQEAMRGR